MKALFIALLLAGLTSCSKKTPDPSPTPTVVGTWKFVTETVVATPVGGGASTSATQTFSYSELLSFLVDGRVNSSTNGQTSATGTYLYTGSTLRITGTNHPQTYQVASLTTTEMVLTSSGNDGRFRYEVTDKLSRVL